MGIGDWGIGDLQLGIGATTDSVGFLLVGDGNALELVVTLV